MRTQYFLRFLWKRRGIGNAFIEELQDLLLRIPATLHPTNVSTELAEVESFLHRQIPMTAAMGVHVASYNGESLVLGAPLSLNHNHLGTGFAGSLNALTTLAGYAFLWLELRERPCHVVLRDSSISFRRPVTLDPRAVCRRPDAAVMETFHGEFTRTGKARVSLHVTIEESGKLAVAFAGTFVALR